MLFCLPLLTVYLAFAQDFCKMERVNLRVTDDGFTRIDDQGKPVKAAMEWKNLEGFRDLLADRLTGKPSKKLPGPKNGVRP